MNKIPPFWRYYGGKHRHAGSYPEPLPGLPIVEPFAGSAGYACRWGVGRDVLLLDVDPVVSGIWRWLIQATPDDVRGVGDIPEGGTVDDIDAPLPARWLAGFWCNNGAAAPCKRPSKWAAREPGAHDWRGQWGGWSHRSRDRVASNLHHIRRWIVLEADYSVVGDLRATWFVDPPYQGDAGSHYVHGSDAIDYTALGAWCRSRQGLTVVCESDRATWLPWNGSRMLRATPSRHRKPPRPDVVWCSDPSRLSSVWGAL